MKRLIISELIAILIVLGISFVVCLTVQKPDDQQVFTAAMGTALLVFIYTILAISNVSGTGTTALATMVAILLAILISAKALFALFMVIAVLWLLILPQLNLTGSILLNFFITVGINFCILYYLPRLI